MTHYHDLITRRQAQASERGLTRQPYHRTRRFIYGLVAVWLLIIGWFAGATEAQWWAGIPWNQSTCEAAGPSIPQQRLMASDARVAALHDHLAY